MTLVFTLKLVLKACSINIEDQKIDGSTPEMFGIALAGFWKKDKLDQPRFFQKLFLLANINVKRVLEKSFLTISNIDILFIERELTWRSYTIIMALFSTKWVKFINKSSLNQRLIKS